MTTATRPLARPLLVVVVAAAAALGTAAHAQTASAPELKAAFLLNFVKFATWSGVQPGASVALCVLDDDRIGDALTTSVRGQTIEGHTLNVQRPKGDAPLQSCHVLFVPGSDPRKVLLRITAVKELPVLTVSDARGFAESGGMIELYEENGRMRFAINVETVQKSGVKLSSRLLDLARIVKNDHGS